MRLVKRECRRGRKERPSRVKAKDKMTKKKILPVFKLTVMKTKVMIDLRDEFRRINLHRFNFAV